jgi:hypothetical protein
VWVCVGSGSDCPCMEDLSLNEETVVCLWMRKRLPVDEEETSVPLDEELCDCVWMRKWPSVYR